MKSAWARHLQGTSRALGWTIGIALITLAVMAALAQVLLPALARHPQWVAAQLSERLHRPVSFEAMEGRWTPAGPSFALHGVRIGERGPGQTPLQIPQADLLLDFGGWLLPSRHLLNLRARGLTLDLERGADGHWSIGGLGSDDTAAAPVSLEHLSLDLWLDELTIDVADQRLDRHYRLVADQLRAGIGSGRVRLGARLHRQGVRGVLTAAGDFRDDGSSGRVWLAGDDLDVKPLLGDIDLAGYTAERGRGQLAAWLDWRGGKVVRSVLQADLAGVSLQGPGGARAEVDAVRGVAEIRQSTDGYRVSWVGDDGSALVAALHRPQSPDAHVGVAATHLQLAPLAPWLALKPELAPGLAHWLGAGKPRGELSRAALQWQRGAGLVSLQVQFRGLGIDAVDGLPGLDHLDGTLRGDAAAVSLELPAQAAVLDLPRAFRQPFALDRVAGTLAFWRGDEGTHIGIDALQVAGRGFDLGARGDVLLPAEGGAPFLDVYARVEHADVTAAKLFWPRSMSERAVQWLDRALVGGSLDEGAVLVRGSLADWPFRHNEGRFEAQGTLNDLTLDYGERWPRAEHVHAVASFVDNGMLVQASSGDALGLTVERAVALIPDFGDAMLDLNVTGTGTGGNLMNFVRRSPIGAGEADTLSKLQLGGKGDFNFHLQLPFKPGAELTLGGTAQLTDADLLAPEWKLRLDGLTGPLQFDAHGLRAGPLQAGFRGQPSSVQMRIADATGDPNLVFSASMDGRYSLAELVQDQPAIGWLGEASDGRADVRIGFDISRDAAGAPLHQLLTVDSTLQGIALKLPAPLDKPGGSVLPLHVTLPLPTASADLQVALDDVLRARFRLPGAQGEPLGGALVLGGAMPDRVPAQGLRVRGHGDRLDVSGWIAHVMSGSGNGDAPTLESIDVTADHASVFDAVFPGLHLQVQPEAGELSVDADSRTLSGHFQVPTADLDRRGITARLKHLYWPKAAAPAGTPERVAERAPDTGPTPAQAARTGINPASLPPLHLLVDDLRLGDARLGEARLESWPTASGMHLDQLRALSRSVQITASGDWNGTPADSQTHMRIDFAAEDLGKMLSVLGFDGLFDGGKTRAHLDGRWPGGPSAITLANLDGTLDVDVTDGRIPEAASPGVGRLLGLVSLAEVPRRLTLDFGDVFGKGLAFDRIHGSFVFADSVATTSNLKISGPAAEIAVSGRTGLRARDYNQQLLVVPHVGNSLPVVGAVVGGPVGAAAGFAVQGLLGKGLNKAASARYTITGSWDKPVITLVEKRAAPPAAPAPAASAPAPALPAEPVR
ncbi:YhdP family protein [Dyella sp.]|uniref:YhdP family protein n=1 Tax=Dyella sp. TaxID=1869338 RepID=UPI002D77AF03|nr:YhdP family protein [Dyella sp.]HET6432302.1 YhdP family protein [Dyella sp.]